MSTVTKSMSMSINKDNEVVVNNDTTVVRTKKRLTAEERQEKGQTVKKRRQTAEKRQEKGQFEKERKKYFDTELENEIAQYPASKKQASIVDDLEDDEEVEESSASKKQADLEDDEEVEESSASKKQASVVDDLEDDEEVEESSASKKQASIVADLEDDEEAEESSLISGFEMSDPLQLKELITASKMAELITVTNEVNNMCSPTVAISVSVENNKTSREIAYDFFMTNKQLVNWKMKEIVGDWGELKKKVMELINDHLKMKMIRQAQKERLCISYEGTKRLATSYKDIGRSFKDDGSVENVRRISSIVTGQFANDTGYQADIEK